MFTENGILDEQPQQTKPDQDDDTPSMAANESAVKNQADDCDEVDPLDAYMAAIEAQISTVPEKGSELLSSNTQDNNQAKDLQNTLVAEEDKDEFESTDSDSPLEGKDILSNPQEFIALMAQTVGKRKDLTPVDHSTMKYPPFRKTFYIEAPAITAMSEAEVLEYRDSLDGIKIRGKKCPRPVKKWIQCGLDVRILQIIKRFGYEHPTPIQAQALPAIMSGRDIIGIAKTGSGKTIAFLLPMFRHVLDQPPLGHNDGPIALIMTPTRELAMQTYFECRKFTSTLGLRVVCASGGSPIKEQIADLKRGTEILIATPGRLLELLTANSGRVTNLMRVTYCVLDEADRMFDMGFGPQVLRIIGNVRPDKQAVLFSATFPRQMEALARKILHKPLEIVVGGRSVVCSDVRQIVEVFTTEEEPEGSNCGPKFLRLLEILGEWYPSKAQRILIFVDKQDAADLLMRDLLKRGYPSLSTHGGKDQEDRESALADFKSGVAPVLVATSVAARGLDVKDLNLVINYECPNHLEDYVHRAGRTGRAGRKGTAITFVTAEQAQYAGDICKALRASSQPIPDALQRLAEEHAAKVSAGQARTVGSGFGGKGLDRIEEEHRRLRRSQKRLLGAEIDDEDCSSDEEVVSLSTKKSPTESPLLSGRKITGSPSIPAPALDKIREISAKIGSVAAAEAAVASINSRFPAKSAAASTTQVSGEIYPIYEASLTSTSASASPRAIRAYYCEIELNDYPQIVRFRLTHKDTVHQILELASGASITVRGEYVPPGKAVREGIRKLYVRIDADREWAVERARSEIKRLLVQFTREAADRGAIDYSRYDL